MSYKFSCVYIAIPKGWESGNSNIENKPRVGQILTPTFRWKRTLLRRKGSRNESFDTDAAMRARKRAGWYKHTLGDGPTLIITRNYSKGPK